MTILFGLSGSIAAAKSGKCFRVISEEFQINDQEFDLEYAQTTSFLPIFRKEVISIPSQNLWLKVTVEHFKCHGNIFLQIPSREIEHVRYWQVRNAQMIGEDHYQAFRNVHQYYPFRHSPKFKIATDRDGISELYLNIRSERRIPLTYSIETKNSATAKELTAQVYFLLFLGIASGLTIYNLYLYSSTKDRTYLLFVAYAFAVTAGLMIEQGNADLLFPRELSWYKYLNIVVAFALYLKIQCVREMLPLQIQAPKIDTYVNRISYSSAAVVICDFIPGISNLIDNYFGLYVAIITAVCVAAATLSYLRDFKPARILLIAWSLTLILVTLRFLTQIGQMETNSITENAYKIGLTIELIFLAVVLADKINLLQKELTRLNESLELKINNRTKQLKQANKRHKENQAHVIESEKFAALGRIADALAHEVNTPLMIIRTGASILHRHGTELEQKMIERRTDQIERAVDKIEKIVKALTITYLNPTTNKDGKGVDIKEYLQSIIDLHSGQCLQHEIALTTNLPDELTIPGNPLHLADIISELFNGAINAVIEAPNKWIEINVSRVKQDIIIIIKDSATTQQNDERSKMFEEINHQTKSGSNIQEATTGISIASQVLKSYGGTIKFIQNTFYTQSTIKFPMDLNEYKNDATYN